MLATNCLASMHTYIFISSYLNKQTKQETLSPDTRRQHRSIPLETKKTNEKNKRKDALLIPASSQSHTHKSSLLLKERLVHGMMVFVHVKQHELLHFVG